MQKLLAAALILVAGLTPDASRSNDTHRLVAARPGMITAPVARIPRQPPARPLSRVSGLSPFTPGCNGTVQVGTPYPNAEVEPWVASHPLDRQKLVGVWQQDRWSTGSASGVLTATSDNGGRVWVVSARQPPFSRCTEGNETNGGDYERATDPWVTYAPNGDVYQSSLSTLRDPVSGGMRASAILVSKSTDEGRTWSDAVTLIRDDFPVVNDKETITADPNDPDFVYVVWTRVANAMGPTLFARTIDGGQTWERARVIYDPGFSKQTLSNQIVVLPDGTLVNLFTELDFSFPTRGSIRVIRSTNKGLTWSAPTTINDLLAVSTSDPTTGELVRTGDVPQIAAGRTPFFGLGRPPLYVVWADARFSNGQHNGIVASLSFDAGLTWTVPRPVNRNRGVAAFMPTIHVIPGRRGFFGILGQSDEVGISYYDFRDDTPAPDTLLTDHWLATFVGLFVGIIGSERHVEGPFDLRLAPRVGALSEIFVGDYQGLSSTSIAGGGSRAFVAFFVQTNTDSPDNPTDVVAARLSSQVASLENVAIARPPDPTRDEGDALVSPPDSLASWEYKVHEHLTRVMQRVHEK